MVGSPIGLGSKCWVDMGALERQCSIFSCYKEGNITLGNNNGCSYIPDRMLNYEACVIHDLCYVTPGTNKTACDNAMEKNIVTIYCDNLNRLKWRMLEKNILAD